MAGPFPGINPEGGYDNIRKIDALISFYFHIPFPEDLPDDVWLEKWRQIEWLGEAGVLGVKKSE